MRDTPVFRASGAARIALCPGSAKAEAMATALTWGVPEAQRADAEKGDRVHAYLAAKVEPLRKVPVMSDDERDVAESLWAAKERHLKASKLLDERVEWHVKTDGWRGTLDYLVTRKLDSAFINDWKSGWGDQDDPAQNAQLRVYVVAAADTLGLDWIEAALTTPRGVINPVVYDKAAIAAATQEIAEIHKAACQPNAPRVPNPSACKFCTAFGTQACPETCKLMDNAKTLLPESEIATMPAPRLGAVAAQWKLVEKLGAMLESVVRARLQAGEEIPGCALRPSGSIASVTDANMAFAMLKTLTQEQFLSACKVSIPGIADAVYAAAKATGEKLTKDAARKQVESVLATVIERKDKSPSLIITG